MKKRDKTELDKIYSKYKSSVNMSYLQMQKWASNPWSKKASLSRAPINRNLRLLKKPKSTWTKQDIEDAKKTIAFNSRMKKVEKGKPVNKDIPLSKRDISLRNWAWNSNKKIPF